MPALTSDIDVELTQDEKGKPLAVLRLGEDYDTEVDLPLRDAQRLYQVLYEAYGDALLKPALPEPGERLFEMLKDVFDALLVSAEFSFAPEDVFAEDQSFRDALIAAEKKLLSSEVDSSEADPLVDDAYEEDADGEEDDWSAFVAKPKQAGLESVLAQQEAAAEALDEQVQRRRIAERKIADAEFTLTELVHEGVIPAAKRRSILNAAQLNITGKSSLTDQVLEYENAARVLTTAVDQLKASSK